MIVVQIAGRLGADPETRYTANNNKVTTMRIATNVWKGGKEETVWWRTTVWGDQFDKMLSFLKKGSAVIVTGEMQPPEIYNNRNGDPQVSMELTAQIIKFSPSGQQRNEAAQAYGDNSNAGGNSKQNAAPAAGNAQSFDAEFSAAPAGVGSGFNDNFDGNSEPPF
jgi:single-strand DNA-binding protein